MTIEQSAPGHTSLPGDDSTPVVLIVDDSRVMRVALSRLLSKRYRVLEAEDGEQGWQAVQDHPDIELVFCDLSMPEVDGFEVLRRVRASEDKSIASLPFVVITGHEDDEGMQRKAAEMGASDFVSKPFRSAEITTRAKTLIGQRRDMCKLRSELDSRMSRDGTTGLANAAHFTEHFGEILSLALRHGLASTCLVLAVDRYRTLAARLSRDELHGLLRDLATQLQAATRSEDAIGYLGDGRYAVAMSGTGEHGARLLAQRLAARLDAAATVERPAPGLLMGVSTPVSEDTTSAVDLVRAAQDDLQPLPVEPEPPAATEPDTTASDIESVLSRVESVLSQSGTVSETASLRRELEQAREALQAAEQTNAKLSEQIESLREGARAQVAKAHHEMAKARSQLQATEAQFREYMQQHSREAQEQAEEEIAELRAVLAERDVQVETESVLRRQAQEMVAQLQSQVAEATREAAEAEAPSGGLASRLFGRH